MSTLYMINGTHLFVNGDRDVAKPIREYIGIDDVLAIDREAHVLFESGEQKKEFDVKPGDVLITFYGEKKNRIVKIDSPELYEIVMDERRKTQEAKEEWAAKHADTVKLQLDETTSID